MAKYTMNKNGLIAIYIEGGNVIRLSKGETKELPDTPQVAALVERGCLIKEADEAPAQPTKHNSQSNKK